MSAFSYHEHYHPPFVTDSAFYPTSSNAHREEDDCGSEETIPCFSEPSFLQTHHQLLPSIVHATIPEAASSLEAQLQSNIAKEIDRLETSAEKNSTQMLTFSAIDNKRQRDSFSSSLTYSRDERENREGMKKHRKLNEEDNNSEEAPKGYIHVRARRGQATDSHSLAERVRREKISERMKLLQSLVPGCEKVTGKALMLDEIINYVQSLQNQVEFLSMKLACVNPMFCNLGMDVENLMFRPEQCGSSSQPNSFAETFFSTPNYPLLDASNLHHQEHIPNELSQDSGDLIWELDDERHKLLNQTDHAAAVFNPSLYYFH